VAVGEIECVQVAALSERRKFAEFGAAGTIQGLQQEALRRPREAHALWTAAVRKPDS
jgi:hypothetical protein